MKSVIAICFIFLTIPLFQFSDIVFLKNLSKHSMSAKTDSDGDGLTDKAEKELGTNPYAVDTDNDGLSDSYEVNPPINYPELRNLNPRHADMIVYFKWRPEITRNTIEGWINGINHIGVIDFFKNLYTSNPDGISGINFIPIYGGSLPANETLVGPDLIPKYFPADLKGFAHWHELYNGSAGKSATLASCTGGSSGSDRTWQSIVHELGHQLGLSHRGPDNVAPEDKTHPLNPMYPSLMSYAYSYGIYNDGNKINFSYGAFKNIILNETDLSEFYKDYTIEELAFLKYAPFNYSLKSSTNPIGTYIDWNRDGIFGQSHYRCDINYFGSNTTPVYDNFMKDQTCLGNVCAVTGNFPSSPVYLLYPTDPSLSASQSQSITSLQSHPAYLSIWKSGGAHVIQLTDKIVRGDISAVKNNSWLYISFPVTGGVMLYQYSILNIEAAISVNIRITPSHELFISQADNMKSQLVNVNNEIYLFTWCERKVGDLNSNKIFYRQYNDVGELNPQKTLAEKSQSDIGLCWDPENQKLCMVTTVALGIHSNRLQLVRYNFSSAVHEFQSASPTLMGLTNGEPRTGSRPSVVFVKLNASMPGRVYAFYQGDGNTSSIYCSRQVGDITYKNGWEDIGDLEGASTMSIVSVANYNNDIVLAFRSNGDNNNTKSKVSLIYNGSGIQQYDMRDYNDVEYIRNVGLKKSLENCR